MARSGPTSWAATRVAIEPKAELNRSGLRVRRRPLKLRPNLVGDLGQARILDCLHRDDRIDGRDFDAAVSVLLHDDIAGQHGADLVLKLQGPISELRVAGAQDAVGTELLAKLRLHGCPDVDIGEDAEALAPQGLGRAPNGIVEARRQCLGKIGTKGRAERNQLQRSSPKQSDRARATVAQLLTATIRLLFTRTTPGVFSAVAPTAFFSSSDSVTPQRSTTPFLTVTFHSPGRQGAFLTISRIDSRMTRSLDEGAIDASSFRPATP